MPKLSRKKLPSDRYVDFLNDFWTAVTLMQSKDEIRSFFKDVLTPTEVQMVVKRLQVARKLLNNLTYEVIERDVCVTPSAIAAVSDVLTRQGEGFRLAIDHLQRWERKQEAEQSARQRSKNPFLKSLRQKTVLGTALKVGVRELDKKITKTLKQRTARKRLPE